MKRIFIFLFLFPFFGFAQIKKATTTTAPGGFVISGDVAGFTDGTPISFINDQTNLPEKQASINKGKFVIKGEMKEPGFKRLKFGDEPYVVSIFLDNSHVKISGNKNAIDKLIIKGSPSHTLFTAYSNSLQPYEKIFLPNAPFDSVAVENVEKISVQFIKMHPTSSVALLAIIRMFQADQNAVKAEEAYSFISDSVKSTQLGQYLNQQLQGIVNQQIQESRTNPIGSVIKDFTQKDTAGNPVNISSFRGKYVLLDFWASWCRPCRMENPNVVAAYHKFHDRNFTVLGISLDQTKEAWLDAIKMDGLTWSHVSDLKFWKNEVALLFQISSIPQNLLIDPNGVIIGKNLRGPVLEGRLAELLK